MYRRKDNKTEGQIDGQMENANTRFPWQTFQAEGIKKTIGNNEFILSIKYCMISACPSPWLKIDMCLWNKDAPGGNKVIILQISKSHILTPPHPQGHVMSVKFEQPLDELTVQVWLLYDHPNFKYCT